MTDLEHADISRRLALAIGYPSEFVRRAPDAKRVIEVNRPSIYGDSWYRFEFDSPDVIWPIAERFNAFPWVYSKNRWHANVDGSGPVQMADTAALAVALAVIKAKEAK